MIRIVFLGTAAARPTVRRGVSSIAVQREGDLYLFDCGEGTQRQMMRFGTGFAVRAVFFSHLHADHLLGIIGLVRTLGLQAREEPLALYGPPGSRRVLLDAVHLGVERTPFEVGVHELEHGAGVEMGEYEIVAYPAQHGPSASGLVLREHDRLGRFDVERARALGIPEGPLFGRLHRGESVVVDGRSIDPAEVVGAPRPGRSVVYSGDTLPTAETIEVSEGADLLIHEATFLDEERARAAETRHTTARQAGEVARRAGVARLVLTHISARYSDDPSELEREARSEFPNSVVAHDGMTIELPYADDVTEPGHRS